MALHLIENQLLAILFFSLDVLSVLYLNSEIYRVSSKQPVTASCCSYKLALLADRTQSSQMTQNPTHYNFKPSSDHWMCLLKLYVVMKETVINDSGQEWKFTLYSQIMFRVIQQNLKGKVN